MPLSFTSHDLWIDAGGVALALGLALMAVQALIMMRAALARPAARGWATPGVTVVVPAYNEEANIARCVRAIVASTYPADRLEILCVDDGSTDATPRLLAELAAEHPEVRVLQGPHAGKATALNLAMTHARHEILVTIDADTFVASGTVAALAAPFADPQVLAAQGEATIDPRPSMLVAFQEVEFALYTALRVTCQRVLGHGVWFFGQAAAFRLSAVKDAGGFATDSLTEDLDMAMRLSAAGRVVVAEGARYLTSPAPSVGELLRQRIRWHAGTWQCVVGLRRVVPRTAASGLFYWSHVFWGLFAWIALPLIGYEAWVFWPGWDDAALYTLGWLTIVGPVRYVWNAGDWGVVVPLLVGVSMSFAQAVLLVLGMLWRRLAPTPRRLAAVALFFPYTLLLNVSTALALVAFIRDRRARFVD